MKAVIVGLLVLAMLMGALASSGVASAQGERDLSPVIERGTTDRLGGGAWISVRAGDARVGVVYGTPDHPNDLYVFAEYKRFLGGADVYDEQGNFLATRGIPVFTIIGQSFNSFIEFEDRDRNGTINLSRYLNDTTRDVPVKATRLVAGWTATEPTVEASNGTTWVNFTVGTVDRPYEIVWDPLPRPGRPADGILDRLEFTFHLQIDIREISGEVPWWRVTVDSGSTRRIVDVERAENRTFSGDAVRMGAKYDHLIEGWDFANPTNRLALETGAFVGHFIPQDVGRFIHAAHETEARDNDSFRHREDTSETDPLLPRDTVYFNDDWERVGRLLWVNDVTVDGRADSMLFQVQGGARWSEFHAGAAFAGFAMRGAYVYPAGNMIEHDPGLEAISSLWALPEALNLTPTTVLALQLAIAGIAMGPAILLRARGRRAK